MWITWTSPVDSKVKTVTFLWISRVTLQKYYKISKTVEIFKGWGYNVFSIKELVSVGFSNIYCG